MKKLKKIKPQEIKRFNRVITKEKARYILEDFDIPALEYIDRHNLQLLYNLDAKSQVIVKPDADKMQSNLRIGYGFNYCFSESIMDRNVTENIPEVPYLHEFLARGCKISFIGKTSTKFQQFNSKMDDWSDEWKKLPRPYRPASAWMEDCIRNYESKYEVEFPEVDLVFMPAFPSFQISNMMFYLTALHYAEKNVPVFLWDAELRTLRCWDKDSFPKDFRYSGADKIFSKAQFRKIVDNSYWLLQIPTEALSVIKSLNPRVRVIPFFPAYSFNKDLGLYHKPRKEVAYRLAYVGNDSERRKTFKTLFTPLSKKNRLHLFGGGMSRRHEGYERFDDYIGTAKLHGAIEQSEVWATYNLSRTCLSIARPRYYNVGWAVHRWFEVVLGGCILLVPRAVYGVDRYMHKAFIVDDVSHLEEKVTFFNDKISYDKLVESNLWQRKFIYRTFSSEKGVDAILRTIGK